MSKELPNLSVVDRWLVDAPDIVPLLPSFVVNVLSRYAGGGLVLAPGKIHPGDAIQVLCNRVGADAPIGLISLHDMRLAIDAATTDEEV